MTARHLLRKLANWAVIAFVAAILYIFATPSYRQGEPSITGSKAKDFPLTFEGRQARLSDFKGESVNLIWPLLIVSFGPTSDESAPASRSERSPASPEG